MTYLVFDVLRLDGRDLTREPLSTRREVLAGLGLDDAWWQVPATYDDGAALLDATAQQGLEGVVSKRLASRYEPGLRSRAWLKFPHRHRTSWVVGGWRPETGSAGRLGALLVGEPTADGGLLYRGRVGSGIAGKVGPLLKELLEPIASDDCPFTDEVPREDARGTHWVAPAAGGRRGVSRAGRPGPPPPAVVPWPSHRHHPSRPSRGGPDMTTDS